MLNFMPGGMHQPISWSALIREGHFDFCISHERKGYVILYEWGVWAETGKCQWEMQRGAVGVGVEKGWVDGWDGTRDRWLTEDGLYIINKKDV